MATQNARQSARDLSHAADELSRTEHQRCLDASTRACSALYASHAPGRPTVAEALRVGEEAYDILRAAILAERFPPAETSDTAFWAAELARQAEESARLDAIEDERRISEADDAFDALHEPYDPADDFHGGDF
jgi:hypothetical protein